MAGEIGGFDLNEILASLSLPGGEKIAGLLDQLGIPPPAGFGQRMGLGGQMPQDSGQPLAGPAPAPQPQAPNVDQLAAGKISEGGGVQSPGTSQEPPGEWETHVNPATGEIEKKKKTGLTVQDIAGLAKTVAPTANHPIMSGGVSGGVKAPDPKVNLAANPVLGALMQAMQAGKGPEAPGTLGRYMR